jgi:putrescine aminotransferase
MSPRPRESGAAHRSADVIARYERHLAGGRAALGRLLGGTVEVASEGAWVTDADGRRYLDFGGYGVFILGHRHPAVTAAVRAQLDTHPLATRVFLEPVVALAAEALAGVTPAGLDRVHFVNSGAEATETALKLARHHGKDVLVSARGGFHGKTLGALSVTANPMYQDPFRPLLPDVLEVPYGDESAVREALDRYGERVCVVLEPVLGEGGVVIPPDGYLRAVADACRAHGAFLVVDEIQTGLGRLGAWWGIEREGVVPDMLLAGKGLSGGVVPVAAVVCRDEVYEPFSRDPFLHSSTFGGSPLACAAALATVNVLREQDVPARAHALGERLLDGVREVCAKEYGDLVGEVRGRGLLIGLEMLHQRATGELALELLERGVIVNHSLNAGAVLRLTPPAIVPDNEAERFLTVLDGALRAVEQRIGPVPSVAA